jgi:hypothetical protein
MDKLLLVGFIKEVMYPAWLKKIDNGQEKQQQVANMCGLHRFKQSLPKR